MAGAGIPPDPRYVDQMANDRLNRDPGTSDLSMERRGGWTIRQNTAMRGFRVSPGKGVSPGGIWGPNGNADEMIREMREKKEREIREMKAVNERGKENEAERGRSRGRRSNGNHPRAPVAKWTKEDIEELERVERPLARDIALRESCKALHQQVGEVEHLTSEEGIKAMSANASRRNSVPANIAYPHIATPVVSAGRGTPRVIPATPMPSHARVSAQPASRETSRGPKERHVTVESPAIAATPTAKVAAAAPGRVGRHRARPSSHNPIPTGFGSRGPPTNTCRPLPNAVAVDQDGHRYLQHQARPPVAHRAVANNRASHAGRTNSPAQPRPASEMTADSRSRDLRSNTGSNGLDGGANFNAPISGGVNINNHTGPFITINHITINNNRNNNNLHIRQAFPVANNAYIRQTSPAAGPAMSDFSQQVSFPSEAPTTRADSNASGMPAVRTATPMPSSYAQSSVMGVDRISSWRAETDANAVATRSRRENPHQAVWFVGSPVIESPRTEHQVMDERRDYLTGEHQGWAGPSTDAEPDSHSESGLTSVSRRDDGHYYHDDPRDRGYAGPPIHPLPSSSWSDATPQPLQSQRAMAGRERGDYVIGRYGNAYVTGGGSIAGLTSAFQHMSTVPEAFEYGQGSNSSRRTAARLGDRETRSPSPLRHPSRPSRLEYNQQEREILSRGSSYSSITNDRPPTRNPSRAYF